MAFLRRGYVPHHYEGPPTILLSGFNDSPVLLEVAKISCFEEHHSARANLNIVTVWTYVTQYVVQDSFDAILAKLGEKAVTNA